VSRSHNLGQSDVDRSTGTSMIPISQQHQQTGSQGRLGNDSVSVALAQLHQMQQTQQPFGVPSSVQQHGYHSDPSQRNLALHQQFGYNTLNQEQQYQLLLEQHAQQQRERFLIEHQSQLSQIAPYPPQYLPSSIARAQLLRQAGGLYDEPTGSSLPDHGLDWMNFRVPTSATLPSSPANVYQQLTQQPAMSMQSILPAFNFGRSNDLRHLLAIRQSLERNPLDPVGSGPTSLGQHLLGRGSFPTDLGRNSLSYHQHNEGYTMGIPISLPVTLSNAEDTIKLSPHQVLLRMQIEAFQATDDDVTTHTRGRNKPIVSGQVGIRCRHCAHLPVSSRQKGSTYFPATVLGIYQAAQNMSTSHIQGGSCSEMPIELKQKFENLQTLKVASSGAGRPYWAESARQLGLVDTEDGIQFVRSLRAGARILVESESKTDKST
jgi:hypothetical protein